MDKSNAKYTIAIEAGLIAGSTIASIASHNPAPLYAALIGGTPTNYLLHEANSRIQNRKG